MIRLTNHVQRRIAERELDVAWIFATLAMPDWTVPDPDLALTRSYRAIPEAGGRVLRVVHRQHGADSLVVTAFFDRDAKP